MKKFLIVAFFVAGVISCQKEITDDVDPGNGGGGGTTNPATNPLIGTWTFDSATQKSNTRSETIVDGEDDLTISSYTYTTQSNNGVLNINDSLYSLTNFTYSVSTTINALLYTNGDFVDSFPEPLDFYQPPINVSSKYQLINADSIYFPNGSPTTDTTFNKPGGAAFVIDSNKLTITQYALVDTSIDHSGLLSHQTDSVMVKSYYHK